MEKKREMQFDCLREEYRMCSQRIDDFNSKLFSYFNTVLIVVGGYLTFIHGAVKMEGMRSFTPYLLFIALGLAGYQYRRTLILQGYRRYLEDEINKLLGKNTFNFGNLSKERLLKPNFFTSFNAVSYFLVIAWLMFYSNDGNMPGTNFIIQCVLLVAFAVAYIHTETLPRKVFEQYRKKN
jgi:hypothetical protein